MTTSRSGFASLVGRPNAGKSTLTKCIAGIHGYDSGEIVFGGQPVTIHSPKDAARLGIEVVYQDLALCDNLDVVQNMFLGREWMAVVLPRLVETLSELEMEKQSLGVLASLRVTTIDNVRTRVAALSGGRSLPASSVRVLEARYHLNEPFLGQYWYWLDGALHGNLGISIILRENVSTLIASRIWTTAGLVLYASLLILVVGISMGILAGLRPGLLDTSSLVVSAISAATPSFVAAIVLILVFAVQLRWFPAFGNGTNFLDNVRHVTLPAVALAVSSLAIVARVTRAAIREEGTREHVQTALSRGIPPRQLIRRHILRNAAIPISCSTSGATAVPAARTAATMRSSFAGMLSRNSGLP